MSRSVRLLCLVPLIAIGIGSGCSKKEPIPPPQASSQYRIGVSLASLDGPRGRQLKADIEAAAKRQGESSLTIVDAQGDGNRQAAQLAEFLDKRVKVVIISPTDAARMAGPVAKLVDAGVGVIVLGKGLVGGKHTCLIAGDQKQLGAAAGKWLGARLHGKGKIVELRAPVDDQGAEQTREAFHTELRDPGYRVVFSEHVDPPRMNAAKLMGTALGRIEAFDAVFAYNDAAAYAAYQTAKVAGREKDVLFVGVGGLPDEGARYVTDGMLAASVVNPTGGAEAIEIAAKLLAGEEVPKTIVPATRVIQ